MYKQIFVFDVETTGLDHKNNQIIELGGLLLNEKLEAFKQISTFVKYNGKLEEKIIEITNITDEMLLDGIDESELAKMLDEIITPETLIVAYNVQFDIGFLISLLDRYGYEFKNNAVLDCMVVYKERHPYPHRLVNAIETYKLDAVNSHRALDDAVATVLLFEKMNEEKNLFDFVNKISYHSKYGLNGHKLPYVEYYPYVYK